MGDNYVVIPFDPDGEVASWLKAEKVRFSASLEKSPTRRELISVVQAIPSSTLEQRKTAQGRLDLWVVRNIRGEAQRADLWCGAASVLELHDARAATPA